MSVTVKYRIDGGPWKQTKLRHLRPPRDPRMMVEKFKQRVAAAMYGQAGGVASW